MGTILEQLPSGARVAVIRLRSLGDCVLTTPALEVLRRRRPDLKVAVVVEERFRPIFEGNPDLDALVAPSVRELAGWRPELCLNLHGGTRSAVLTILSGARFRAGFAHYRYSTIYNVRIPTAQQILGVSRKVHTAEHLASAMFYLGAGEGEVPRAKLFVTQAEAPAPQAPYAVLHPVASTASKTWPVEGFLEVAARLQDNWHLEPVFIAGAGEDLSPFGAYRTVVGPPLGQLKSLVAGAAMFIGNDSGPAHVAAAFQVPSLVIFGASDPDVWAPWRTACEVLIARGDIRGIAVSEVLGALERLRVAA
ncbi:MAG: glycosyltransferase family 9 protein [Bryobacteraceae bacterium]|jgi:ADP-heptose:LPS heptosyltransferase